MLKLTLFQVILTPLHLYPEKVGDNPLSALDGPLFPVDWAQRPFGKHSAFVCPRRDPDIGMSSLHTLIVHLSMSSANQVHYIRPAPFDRRAGIVDRILQAALLHECLNFVDISGN